MNLLTAPFATLSVNSNAFKQSLEQLLVKCLSIPLLPNRLLSSNSLATFSSRLPLSHLDKLDPSSVLRDLPILENRIHLLANLGTFIPVSRITPSTSLSLPPQAINVYVRLLAVLISSLPADALEPLHSNGDEQADVKVRNADSDSDSEVERSIRVEVVESFQSKAKISRLDGRTLTRLQNLRSPAYINAILAAMQRNQADQPSFFAWGIALCNVWPNRKGQILGLFVVYGGGGLVRELYRGYVRNSSIGQDNNPSSLSGLPHDTYILDTITDGYLRSSTSFGVASIFVSC